jgi:hypothetical protein
MDRFEIYRDVAYAMRESVIDNTPFERSNYHTGIVPNAAWPAGFKADLPFWAVLLKDVEARLHAMNERYRVLHVTIGDAKATLNKPLSYTNALLTQRIWEGNQPPASLASFEFVTAEVVKPATSGAKPKGAGKKKKRKAKASGK